MPNYYYGIDLGEDPGSEPPEKNNNPIILGVVVALLVVGIAVFLGMRIQSNAAEEAEKAREEETARYLEKYPHLRKYYYPEE